MHVLSPASSFRFGQKQQPTKPSAAGPTTTGSPSSPYDRADVYGCPVPKPASIRLPSGIVKAVKDFGETLRINAPAGFLAGALGALTDGDITLGVLLAGCGLYGLVTLYKSNRLFGVPIAAAGQPRLAETAVEKTEVVNK